MLILREGSVLEDGGGVELGIRYFWTLLLFTVTATKTQRWRPIPMPWRRIAPYVNQVDVLMLRGNAEGWREA